MDLSIENTRFDGVKIISYDSFVDLRGSIWTTYLEDKINTKDNLRFNHDKFSVSYKDVIRGIHYDSKTFKLVTAVYGEIDQVVVDMRKNSETYKESLIFALLGYLKINGKVNCLRSVTGASNDHSSGDIYG